MIGLHLLLLLLLLSLQPTVGFSLLSNSPPFLPFLTQLSPPSYSHYLYISSISSIHLFLGLPLILQPIGFHSNILLGVLFSSIRITWPSQAILLLFINLTMSAFFLLIHSVRNSFWFSRIHLYFALGQRFSSIFYAQKLFLYAVKIYCSMFRLIKSSHHQVVSGPSLNSEDETSASHFLADTPGSFE
jgi:hypothetical protein